MTQVIQALFEMGPRAVRVILAALMLTVGMAAHDLQTSVEELPPFVVVNATYEGTEPASFIAVTVHPPASANIKADAFQTGRTDFEGKFVFRPTAPGEWRVVLDDEMGHRVELVAKVGGAGLAEASKVHPVGEGEGRGTGERFLIGLSVLFGVSGLLYGWMARRQKATVA